MRYIDCTRMLGLICWWCRVMQTFAMVVIWGGGGGVIQVELV